MSPLAPSSVVPSTISSIRAPDRSTSTPTGGSPPRIVPLSKTVLPSALTVTVTDPASIAPSPPESPTNRLPSPSRRKSRWSSDVLPPAVTSTRGCTMISGSSAPTAVRRMAACVWNAAALPSSAILTTAGACSTTSSPSAAAEPYSCRTFDISIAATAARCCAAAPRGRPARAKNAAATAAKRHNGPAKASPAAERRRTAATISLTGSTYLCFLLRH